MLKSMCTVLVEYAILVDWKHKQAHAPARLHSDTWMHAGEYYSDSIFILPTYVQITPIHIKFMMC